MNLLFTFILDHLSTAVGVKKFVKSINVAEVQTKLKRLFVASWQITCENKCQYKCMKDIYTNN